MPGRPRVVPQGAFEPWQAGARLPFGLGIPGVAALGSSFFVLGGIRTVPPANPVSSVDTFYSVLNASGLPGPWLPGPPLPAPRFNWSAAAGLGKVYALGGNEVGISGRGPDFVYAAILPSGGLGPWQTGPGPVNPTGDTVAVLHCGRHLYAFSPGERTVAVMPLASDGTPTASSWRVGSLLPFSRRGVASADLEGRIFMVGGEQNNVYSREVWVSIGAEDGTIDGWERHADLPAPRAYGSLAVLAGRLVYVGGRSAPGVTATEAFVSVATAGVAGHWSVMAGTAPSSPEFLNAAAAGGVVLAAGTVTNPPLASSDETHFARLVSDGRVLNAYTRSVPATGLSDGAHTLSVTGADAFGNPVSAGTSFIVDATPPDIALSVDGVAVSSAFTAGTRSLRPAFTASFSDSLTGVDPASVRIKVNGSDITALAAISPAGASFTQNFNLNEGGNLVELSVANMAGSVAVYHLRLRRDTTAPSAALTFPSSGAVVGAGFTLTGAGADFNSGVSTQASRFELDSQPVALTAELDAPGPLGNWRAETPLPLGLREHRLVALDGWLYLIGGNSLPDQQTTVTQSAVWKARLDAQGFVGTWSTTTAFPFPIANHGAAAANGAVYVVPGLRVSLSGAKPLYYARAGPDGGLGPWQQGPLLPAQELGDLTAYSAENSFLYAVGAGGVHFCPLEADGTPKPACWTQSANLGYSYQATLSISATNGRLYAIMPSIKSGDPTFSIWIGRTLTAGIGPDGHVSDWTYTQDLPPVAFGAFGADAGRLLYAGGVDFNKDFGRFDPWSFEFMSDVNFADRGRAVAWSAKATMPFKAAGSAGAVHRGRFYYAGGLERTVGNPQLPLNVIHSEVASTVLRDFETRVAGHGTGGGLSEGAHEAALHIQDNAGGTARSTAAFFVDLTAPVTTLSVLAASRTAPGKIVTVPGAPISLVAVDGPAAFQAGMGVVYRAVDGSAPEVVSGTFTLSDGFNGLTYWSVDAVGNAESTRSISIKLDGTPPWAVTGLAATALSTHSLRLSWTAPGDDGALNEIIDAQVRIEVRTTPGGASTATARVVMSSGTLIPGTSLFSLAEGLAAGTTYYAAVFTRDAIGNWSAASNQAAARTFLLVTSSDSVASLATPVSADILVVSTQVTTTPFSVAASSQALGSVVPFYELTDGLEFDEAPARLTFILPADTADAGALAIYTFDGVEWTSAAITNQTILVLANGSIEVSGDIVHTSLYAALVRDTAAPLTAFSLSGSSAVLEGRLFAARASSAVLSALDLAPLGGTPSGLRSTLYSLDGGPETAYEAPFAIPEGRRLLGFRSLDDAGNAEASRSTEVYSDAAAPIIAVLADRSTFPVPGGFGTIASSLTLTLTFTEPELDGAAAGLAAAAYTRDGSSAAVAGTLGDRERTVALEFGPGLHMLVARAADRLGQASELSLVLAVGDTMPPVTTLAVGTPQAVLTGGALLVSTATPLSLTAEDFAESGAPSGVARTRYRVSPEAFSVYAGSFSLAGADGAKDLEFYSEDGAGNAEAPKLARLELDATPPKTAFTFPSPGEGGLCRLAQGKVAVRGEVGDAHLGSWSLSQGAVLIGSGTAAASGELGVWDAAGRSGAFELTLAASDRVENSTLAAIEVWAGAPARALVLGGKGLLNKPRGVAAGPDRLYVADTGNDLVRSYDLSGNLLASFGGQRSGVRFKAPAGAAVDQAGNIFVADAGNRRVVKLSPSGVLLTEFGPSPLKRPVAVALVPGKVLVADAKAGALMVFAPDGTFLRGVALPPTAVGPEPEDDPEEPRPMALAADAAGNLWVADAKGGRVLRYDAALNLRGTLEGLSRPEGVAVTPSGSCLAVSEAKAHRIRTFDDALGAGLASFGQHGQLKDKKPLPPELVLDKPAQLAFTAGGNLLAADRGNDAVQGFGLPGTPPVLAWGGPPPSGGARLAAARGDEVPAVARRVGRFEGGLLEALDGAAVDIPAGALVEDQEITLAHAAEAGVSEREALNLAAVSAAREFGPHNLGFARPVTITLPYRHALAAGTQAHELKVHYWNPERGLWEGLDSTVDQERRTVSARVTHFSLYQVLAPVRAVAALAGPDQAFRLVDHYPFPNPARGGRPSVVRVQVGLADSVELNIYDVSGELVHSGTFGPPSALDDGNGKGVQWTYDYPWDTGGVGSGVYVYAFTAKKGGQAGIRRTGRLMVIK